MGARSSIIAFVIIGCVAINGMGCSILPESDATRGRVGGPDSSYVYAPPSDEEALNWDDLESWSPPILPGPQSIVAIGGRMYLESSREIKEVRILNEGSLAIGNIVARDPIQVDIARLYLSRGSNLLLKNSVRLRVEYLILEGPASVHLVARSSSLEYDRIAFTDDESILSIPDMEGVLEISSSSVFGYQEGSFSRDAVTGRLRFEEHASGSEAAAPASH